MSTLIPTIVTGIGIPVVTQWMSGGLKSFKKEATIRNVALASVAGIAIAGLVTKLMEPIPAPAVAMSPCQQIGKSVSDVTVQLGRYAAGVNYPGQLTGTSGASASYTNGGLIYVD